MKINLEFTLPDDRNDFEMSLYGTDLYGVLREFDEHMRHIVKYHGDDTPEEVIVAVANLRTELRKLLEEAGIPTFF